MNKKMILGAMAVALIAVQGCGSGRKSPADPVVAYVNKEPVLTSEVNKSIAMKVRQEPLLKVTPETEKEQLDIIIDKKLIIQEAINKGLAQNERFVSTIKAFWEQTLIKDFIEHKKQEFADQVYVTDEEIRDYYARLGQGVTFRVLKSTNKSAVQKFYDQFKREGKTERQDWDIIGPVSYSEINSEALRKSYDLAVGEAAMVEEEPYYYLVSVDSRQDVSVQPLDTMKSAITSEITAIKEQRLLDDWLKAQRDQARINILKP